MVMSWFGLSALLAVLLIFAVHSTLTSQITLPLTTIMSLLQGVLRSHTADSLTIERKLKLMQIPHRSPPTTSDQDDSDDDLVNVVSWTILVVVSPNKYPRLLGVAPRNPRSY